MERCMSAAYVGSGGQREASTEGVELFASTFGSGSSPRGKLLECEVVSEETSLYAHPLPVPK